MSLARRNERDSLWDYRAIVWTALLVPGPILAFYACRAAGLTVSASEDVVTLLVMLPLGGPHVVATFMRTFADGDFRARERRQAWISAGLYALVVCTAVSSVFLGVRVLGFVPMQLLLTGFFFWASFHVLQQAAFCASSFESKRSSTARGGRWLDLAVLFGSLYPFAFFRMSMIDPTDLTRANPNAFATRLVQAATGSPGFVDEYVFRIGRTTPILPSIVLTDWIWMAILVAYLTLVGAYAIHVCRQWREGTLEWRRFQLVSLTAGIGFFLPLVPNLDSAFQGMNAWHCAQYVRLSWLLHQEQRSAGRVRNPLARWYLQTSSMGRFYGSMFAITVAAILLMFGVAAILSAASAGHWRLFGVEASELARDPRTGQLEYRPGSLLIAYYLLGFGFLLVHYLQDSWLFAAQGSLRVKIMEERVGEKLSPANLSVQ